MWKKQNISLGRIKQKTVHTVRFQYLGVIPFEVLKLQVSCGCTKPKFTREKGTLEASFVAPSVPQHLLWKGEYTTTKKIKMYTDKGEFEFTFKATIFQE